MEKFSGKGTELAEIYEQLTGRVEVEVELTTIMVGGVGAKREAVEAFVKHQMHLEGEEAEREVSRILKEEIGERELPGTDKNGDETGELQDKQVYGINVVRKDSIGPWLGSWMVNAILKNACTRIGLFEAKKGAKGDMCEAGRIIAAGMSKQSPDRDKIHLYKPNGANFTPPETYFDEFSGSVNTPKGRTSIKHHSECVPVGTRFSFEFRFMPTKINKNDVMMMLALAGEVGIGSMRGQHRGKFKVISFDGEIPESLKKKREREKEEAKAAE